MLIANPLTIYLMALCLQLPFLFLEALPLLVVAALIRWAMRRSRHRRLRLVLITGVVAVGIAPASGAHASMVSAYLLVISGPGNASDPANALLSILVTWCVLLGLCAVIAARAPGRSDSRVTPADP